MMKLNLTIVFLAFGLLTQLSNQIPAASIPPPEVISYQASRMTRFHHNFFHQTRMLYLSLTPNAQSTLSNLGWAPPRPVTAYLKDGTSTTINGDGGEDFLFMHRRMIAKVNKIAEDAGSAWRVVGWPACPLPTDTDWPVPPAYEIPGDDGYTAMIRDFKTDEFYTNTIVPMETMLDDADYLRTLSLGELGLKLELEIHTWFHVRFSAPSPHGYRTQHWHPTASIDAQWDVETYDWLSDFYSAHVNPYFWKIHGWIESKITNWMTANSIARINWVGTWETGPMDAMEDLFQAAVDAEAEKNGETTMTVIKQKSKAGIILGGVLGSLALTFTFIIIMTLLLKKKTAQQVFSKQVESATQSPQLQTY